MNEMDDRVHARLCAIALDHGLSPEEALRYADARVDKIEGNGIRLELAVDDLKASLAATRVGRTLESVAARFAAALDRVARR